MPACKQLANAEGGVVPAFDQKAALADNCRDPRPLCIHFKRGKSAQPCGMVEPSGDASLSLAMKPGASSSCPTFDQAGTSTTCRFGPIQTDPTAHTGMLGVSWSFFVTISASWVRSVFTFPERPSCPASRAFLHVTLPLGVPAFPTYQTARLRFPPLPRTWTTSLLALAATFFVPLSANAEALSLLAFTEDAKGCAQHVAVETLAAVARTESGFDVLTLHDNSTGRTYHPANREDAIALGVELVTVNRHSVDLGLMQINSGNLPRLGLSVSDTFDPCLNLSAADRVLVEGYVPPPSGQDTQPAVQQALSRYNTGDPARGVANGYVNRVQVSAELVVPALRVKGDVPPAQPVAATDNGAVLAQPLPPIWDVYGRAKASHGQVFGASAAPPPTTVPTALSVVPAAPPNPAGPAPGQRLSIEALNDVR